MSQSVHAQAGCRLRGGRRGKGPEARPSGRTGHPGETGCTFPALLAQPCAHSTLPTLLLRCTTHPAQGPACPVVTQNSESPVGLLGALWSPHQSLPQCWQAGCFGFQPASLPHRDVLATSDHRRLTRVHSENNGGRKTNLSHLLAQALENNVTKGVRWHLLDMFFGVPILALQSVGPGGLLQVLLACVSALTHHLPAKTAQSLEEASCLCAPLWGVNRGPMEVRTFTPQQ